MKTYQRKILIKLYEIIFDLCMGYGIVFGSSVAAYIRRSKAKRKYYSEYENQDCPEDDEYFSEMFSKETVDRLELTDDIDCYLGYLPDWTSFEKKLRKYFKQNYIPISFHVKKGEEKEVLRYTKQVKTVVFRSDTSFFIGEVFEVKVDFVFDEKENQMYPPFKICDAECNALYMKKSEESFKIFLSKNTGIIDIDILCCVENEEKKMKIIEDVLKRETKYFSILSRMGFSRFNSRHNNPMGDEMIELRKRNCKRFFKLVNRGYKITNFENIFKIGIVEECCLICHESSTTNSFSVQCCKPEQGNTVICLPCFEQLFDSNLDERISPPCPQCRTHFEFL